MERLADLVVRRGRTVLVLCGLVVAAGLYALRDLERSQDILAFLPAEDPQVALFRSIGARFGGLEAALVGVEADEVFRADVLEAIRAATERLRAVRGVESVLSLTEMPVTRSTEEELRVGSLVPRPVPRDEAALAALREQALGDSNVVGSVLSRDGRAALMIAFLADGADPRRVTASIREAVGEPLSGLRVTFGGVPFFGDAAASLAERDLARLTPVAALAILLVLFLFFRDALGIAMALGTVAAGAVVALGGMAAAGEPFTLVSGALPVVLFACGIGYALHVLASYDAARERLEPAEAVRAALVEVGPPVLYSGLTTAAGFGSFLAMGIRPMRTFGLFATLGILATLAFALLALPAALAMGRRRAPRPAVATSLRGFARAVAGLSARRPAASVAASLLVALLFASRLGEIPSQIATANFFVEGSEPYEAERLLGRRFGGSQFVQIHVRGDLTDPRVLRGVRDLARAAARIEGVREVRAITAALEQTSEAMGEGRRLPETRAQAQTLFFLLEGEPSLVQLVDARRSEALLHLRLGALDAVGIERALDRVERLAARDRRLKAAVTGMPSVHHALARSVVRSQVVSALTSLGLVVLLAALLFRSLLVGLLASVPSAVTLVTVFGAMGLARIPLDVGTSMIACIGLGAGIDQAIHFLWHMRPMGDEGREACVRRAADIAGPAIVAGALMVTAGFAILALGDTLPMRHFGLLTAAALLFAAVATFVLVPATARGLRRRATDVARVAEARVAAAKGGLNDA